MSQFNELNDLVNLGKAEIDKLVRAHISASLSYGAADEKQVAMRVSSLLALSIQKEPPKINMDYIRALIIEENAEFLSGVENGEELIGLFAQATGRVTQIQEYRMALCRIEQTCESGTPTNEYVSELRTLIEGIERASVRFYRDAVKWPRLKPIGGGQNVPESVGL